uniref:Phage protein n=1 Tax=Klebsiella phage FKP3 TaxID=3231233 RepID=A0AAU8HZ26_9CAUD
MNKGDVVRCVKSRADYITEDRLYTVEAGYGDNDVVCGGTVLEHGMILTNDRGHKIYALYPECLFGAWEIVE